MKFPSDEDGRDMETDGMKNRKRITKILVPSLDTFIILLF